MTQEGEYVDKKRMELRDAGEAKDWNRYARICRDALAKVSQDDFTSWYAFSFNLAVGLVSNEDSDNRANNIEEAIKIYKNILQRLSYINDKNTWASIQRDLGYAYSERLVGDKITNINKAIKHYEQSLQVFTADTHLEDWILTKRLLAELLAEKMDSSALDNLDNAIKLCEKVLEKCNDESTREHQIEIQEMIDGFRKKRNYIKDRL